MREHLTILEGKASDEQIAAWKKMWGEVYEIEVSGHYCYLRKFDRATLKLGLSQMSMDINAQTKQAKMDMGKIIDMGEVALQNCMIASEDVIETNDSLWIGAAMQAGELFDFAEASLKKY